MTYLRSTESASPVSWWHCALLVYLSSRWQRLADLSVLSAALIAHAGCASMTGTEGPYAVISALDVSQPANKTYPVIVQGIDGKRPSGAGAPNVSMLASVVVAENVVPNRYDFPVAPGDHYVHLTAVLRPSDEAAYLGVVPRSADNGLAIGVTLEEGKRYILGAQIDGSRVDGWRPTLVAVESIRNYRSPAKHPNQGEGDLKSDR